ncbi:hypothetical protein [Pontibacter beigongshangensis]|uniref:hypothetical protein n=1 Tax=Pontibacter beigongshangensis TaxID=2574733 RepID=UPI0016509A17|nr:hypothetical protein [Pontibacter beigongshangensis]
MKRILLLLIVATTVLSGCGPQIYQSNNFAVEKQKHKVVAILPFEVLIEAKRLPKGVTAQMLQEQQRDYGYGLQGDVYGYFLKQMSKDRYTVTFQDVSKTNAILNDAFISYEDLRTYSKDELCRILGVDAVVSGKTTMSKPMSDGAAIAVGLLVGAWGSTNSINTTVTVHEGEKGDLMWKYDYMASGSVGSSRQSLSNALMKNTSKKFPYKKS